MKHLRSLLAALLLAVVPALFLLCAGCATIDQDTAQHGGEELPWNTPADWEGSGLGLPY